MEVAEDPLVPEQVLVYRLLLTPERRLLIAIVETTWRDLREPRFRREAQAWFTKSYKVTKVIGDKYAGVWPTEAFAKQDVAYEPSAAPKSDLYRDTLPLLNSGRIELPDLPRLHAQLLSLERRTARGGRDSIDHPPGAHDDLANVVAGVALEASHAIGSGEVMAPNLSETPRQRVAANASPLEMGGSGYTSLSRRNIRDEMPR